MKRIIKLLIVMSIGVFVGAALYHIIHFTTTPDYVIKTNGDQFIVVGKYGFSSLPMDTLEAAKYLKYNLDLDNNQDGWTNIPTK